MKTYDLISPALALAHLFRVTRKNSHSRSRRGNGFTVVEVLVVICIITVLASMLVPSVMRAREQARQVTCLSKMRQLGSAMMSYLASNENYFPKPAVTDSSTRYWYAEDWVYWEPPRLVNNQDAGVIWPYLTNPGGYDPSLLICPSDNISSHGTSEGYQYPYSFTMNEFLCRTDAMRHSGTIRLSRVVNASQTIMIVDESSETIDDGCWAPQNYLGYGTGNVTYINVLSDRHDLDREMHTDPYSGYGNVVFADGHGEWISRILSTEPQYFVAFPGEPAQ